MPAPSPSADASISPRAPSALEGWSRRAIDFARRRPIAAAVLATAVVTAPSLLVPFSGDDFIHYEMLRAWREGRASDVVGLAPEPVRSWGPFAVNVYSFLDGDPDRTIAARDAGRLPWWVVPEIRLRFMRPLASAVLALDHVAFDRWVLGYRLHHGLWWLGLVAAFAGVLRRAGRGSSLAVLAALLLAITDRSFFPVTWLANRHAVVSVLPATLGLWAHLRWREEGWLPGAALGPLGWAVGLLGGETALGAFGYLVAYELWGPPRERASWRRRLLASSPAAAVGLAWALAYRAGGFGTYGSGLYLDPGREPLAYLGAVLTRGPANLLAQLAGISADWWFLLRPTRPLLVVLGILACAITLALLRRAWTDLEPDERRTTIWLGAGGSLALLPNLATMPSDRVLLFPGLGLSMVTAVLLRWGWRHRNEARRLPRLTLLVLGGRHVLAPPGIWLLVVGFAYGAAVRVDGALGDVTFDPARPVMVVQASDPMVAVYLPAQLAMQGDPDRPAPRAWIPWSMARGTQHLRRIDERTVELRASGHGMLAQPFAELFRGPDRALVPGDRVPLPGATFEVIETDGPDLLAIRVYFDLPPEEGPFQLVAWQRGALRPLTLPRPGETMDLPYALGPMGL